MALLLKIVSGVCWTWVYVECIRIGVKQKTCAMPLFALALNFSWEVVYGYLGVTGDATIGTQDVITLCWAILDVVIISTWLRFGGRYWPERFGKPAFVAWGALVLVVSFILQALFVREFGVTAGARYSAFLQNLLMSVLFIDMFVERRGADGQSLRIAVNKWIGTLTPTISLGYLNGSAFITVVGILCSLFDLIYIGLLMKALMRSPRAVPTFEKTAAAAIERRF